MGTIGRQIRYLGSDDEEFSVKMDPLLTWEILSQLSLVSDSISNTDSSAQLPFFAQRNEINETKMAETNGKNPRYHRFFMAYPVLNDKNNFTKSSTEYCLPVLLTPERIAKEFIKVLILCGSSTNGGRLSSSEIGMWLGVDEEQISSLWDVLYKEKQNPLKKNECNNDVHEISKVFNPVKNQYEFALKKNLLAQLSQVLDLYCGVVISFDDQCHFSLKDMIFLKTSPMHPLPTMTIQQLALEMELTSLDVSILLEDLFHDKNEAYCKNLGHFVVSNDALIKKFSDQSAITYNIYLKEQLVNFLSCVTAPISIELIFSDWSINQNLQLVITALLHNLCRDRILSGTLKNATFTPDIYSIVQRRSVDLYFRSNGYITEKKLASFGVSKSRMELFVKNTFPDATALKNSMIDLKHLCSPLETAVNTSILNASIADLKSLLPEEVTSDEDDLKMIVNECMMFLSKDKNSGIQDELLSGIVLCHIDIALFFSASMIERTKKLLVPLVEDYSKSRAYEIVSEKWTKRKTNANKVSKQLIRSDSYDQNGLGSCYSISSDKIPLFLIAKSIAENFPELSEAQNYYHESHDRIIFADENEILWEGNEAICDGPLIEFVRRVFCPDDILRICTRAIKAEADRLMSTLQGVAVSDRLEGAAKTRNTEIMFETSFKDMCYLMQLFAKTIDSLECRVERTDDIVGNAENVKINEMKNELLHGCGSCLAKCITEYCLFKHSSKHILGEALIFEGHTAKFSRSIDDFGTPVDLGALTFPCISLDCKQDKAGKKKEPLMYLASLFSGNIGSNLSHMWALCSQKNMISMDREGSKLEIFLQYLEESCLSLVGIPFARLDKRNEKRVLAARRESLLHLLDCNENDQVLLASTVLIFQLAKNMTIAGKQSIYTVLNFLCKEKKIPSSIKDILLKLKSQEISEELLLQAKQSAQAKSSKSWAQLLIEPSTVPCKSK